MNESELRALVRDAVARHMGRGQPERPPAPVASQPARAAGPHPSHAVYISLVNTTDACVIEPSVPCEHCDYCKSHGH
jgi:hypothetical protein